MFGYVKFDRPNLYIKDFTLYNAVYCGLCKGIKKSCGNIARFALTYDMAFLSAIIHNIKNVDVKITKQRCAEHIIIPHPMAETDELTEKIGALNTFLAYYKLSDDVEDENKGRLGVAALKGGYERALKNYKDMADVVKKYMDLQKSIEKSKTASVDMAADPTSCMLADITDILLGDSASEYTHNLFYALGKWIYIIDAIDDYDKDLKKGLYNPFILSYGESSKKLFIEKHRSDINFMFSSLFNSIRDNRMNIKFGFNTDLVDNVLLRGLPSETKRVLSTDSKNIKNKEEKIKVKGF